MACHALGIATTEFLQADSALFASGWSPRIPSGSKRLPRFGIGSTLTAKRLTPNSAGWSRSWT